jgi:hypothetical protein
LCRMSSRMKVQTQQQCQDYLGLAQMGESVCLNILKPIAHCMLFNHEDCHYVFLILFVYRHSHCISVLRYKGC